MKDYFLKFTQIFTGLLVIILFSLIANAWSEPASAPPGGNVSAPLNTSATTQTKTGKLLFTWFEDQDQPGYYSDPGGNSWLYRLYSYDVRSDIFYDRNNTSYYVDPNSTSVFNTISLGGVSRSSWPSEAAPIPSGMIALFASGCPSGWTRFTALDDRFPRGASSYGGSGGSETHSHSYSGETSYVQGFDNAGPAISGDTRSHSHTYSGNTASASNLPPYLNVVYCQKN